MRSLFSFFRRTREPMLPGLSLNLPTFIEPRGEQKPRQNAKVWDVRSPKRWTQKTTKSLVSILFFSLLSLSSFFLLSGGKAFAADYTTCTTSSFTKGWVDNVISFLGYKQGTSSWPGFSFPQNSPELSAALFKRTSNGKLEIVLTTGSSKVLALFNASGTDTKPTLTVANYARSGTVYTVVLNSDGTVNYSDSDNAQQNSSSVNWQADCISGLTSFYDKPYGSPYNWTGNTPYRYFPAYDGYWSTLNILPQAPTSSGGSGLTDTQLRATPVPVSVSGSVATTGGAAGMSRDEFIAAIVQYGAKAGGIVAAFFVSWWIISKFRFRGSR